MNINYYTDPLLLIIIALLVLTITAFLTGYIPYPFGIIVLTIFLVARLLQLRSNNKQRR